MNISAMGRKTSADLRAELAELVDEAQQIIDTGKAEGREEMTPDEYVAFERKTLEIQEKGEELRRIEKTEAAKIQHVAAKSTITDYRPRTPYSAATEFYPERQKAMETYTHSRVGPLKAFTEQGGVNFALDSGMFLRAVVRRSMGRPDLETEARLQGRGYDILATATEGTPAAGGFLVPAPLANALIDVRALAGISRQVARVMPMSADTLSVAKKVAGTTVYYVGEAAAITPSDQTFSQLGLTAKKRAVLSYMSNELVDDSLIAIADDWASQVGTDFAVKEDAEFINGDGTSTYGGEVGLLAALGAGGVSTAATGHDTWPELDAADFAAMVGLLPDRFLQYGPSFICSSAFYHSVMLRVMLAQGGNTIQAIEQGAAARPRFMGYPVYLTNQMPTTTATATVACLFGAFSQAVIIGSRKETEVRMSEHAAFENDLLALRAIARYDILVHEGGDASNAGAYVGLKTAS